MKVLQIANGYLDKALYANLFEHMDQCIVENLVFVPVGYGDRRKVNKPNVYVAECFSQFDRFLYFKKQKKIISNIISVYGEQFDTIDLTHSHTLFSSGYSSMKLKEMHGIPYIVAIRNTDVNLFFEKIPFLRGVGNQILTEADKVIFLSQSYADLVLSKYVKKKNIGEIEKKIEVIPNGIDDLFFKSAPSVPKTLKDEINIIHVGDINRNKNALTTLAAIERMIADGQKVKFTLIGEMKDERINEVLQSKSFVKIHPKCNLDEIIQYYKRADILVMPSFHETFGLVYAEAMSQGVPVIYTRGQGFDGQFHDGEVGYAVDPNSSDDIVDKIRKITNRYSEIAGNCLAKSTQFRWKYISEKYTDLYRTCF